VHELFNLSVNKFVPGVKPTSMGMKLQVLRYQNTIKMYQNVSQKYQKIILVQKKNNGIKMYYSGIKMYHKGIKKSYWYQMGTMFSSHRIQTNARCEKQLYGKGHSSGSRAVYEFSNGSPSGRSSQRVEGTTDCVFGGTTRVGNMSSETCMREEEANSARGPELDDQILTKGRRGN
jgi:hypothetical protein